MGLAPDAEGISTLDAEGISPSTPRNAMLYAMLVTCAALIFVLALAVPHAAKARRRARLFRAQQEWAELMDRHDSPADDNAVVPRFPSRPDADESNGAMRREPPLNADLWPQLFSDVNCIALWNSSEKILTRLYSVLHWFHKRLEVNVENPREKRCFQRMIACSRCSVDNSKRCTVLWKIAARLITVSTSVNNEMWVKLSP